MDSENKRESIVRLGLEDMSIIKESPICYLQSMLSDYNNQINSLKNEKQRCKRVLEQPDLNDEKIAEVKNKIDEIEASLKLYSTLKKELERQVELEENK